MSLIFHGSQVLNGQGATRHHHRLGVLDPIQDSLLNYDANSPQSMSCLIIIRIQGSVFWNKENKILLSERYIKCPQCTGLPVLQWGNNIICSPMCKIKEI